MNEKEPWHIGRLLSTSSNYWQACLLHAAVRLDVFSCLAAEKIIEMMNRAGVGTVVHLPFRGGNDSSILQGIVE